ncbi:MAG: hypothetical protein NC400_12610 [Clostridium sp.]|nr:hypothetical protein [Clostridium sp.]
MVEIIYGTGNKAKIEYMERALKRLPIKIVGLKEAAAKRKIILSEVEENGSSPLENARLKAEDYYRQLGSPVFSCDSGLYLWNYATKELLPEEEQPGIHVRGRGVKRLSDEELLAYYIGLVKKYGQVCGRFKNGICLVWDENTQTESMAEDLWGEPFLLTDTPHTKRVEGFPLDRISLDLKTGKYIYDIEENAQEEETEGRGFERFFREFLEARGLI